MKTNMMWTPLLPLLGLLVWEPSAWAFYNPQTGRWLSRDPVGEVGANAVYAFEKHDLAAEKTGEKVYEFAGNNGLTSIDVLGTTCIDPCGLAKAMRLDVRPGEIDGDAGGVICCGGKVYICLWEVGGLQNTKAREIVANCIFWHEWSHRNDNEACPCSLWPDRPKRRNEKTSREVECSALSKEYECLKDSLRQCGSDSACRLEVLFTMQFVVHYRDRVCKIELGPSLVNAAN